MYCSKCGQQIPDNSVFCSECGNKCGSDLKNDIIKNAKSNYGEYINYAIAAIKHPINTIKSGGENISTRINLLYIAIIALIVPLIQTIAFRSFIFNGVKSIINSNKQGKNNLDQLIDFQRNFDELMKSFFKFNDVYIFNFLGYILFYGILLGVIYLIYKYLIKANFSLKDFTRVLSVASIINLMFVIIVSLILPINFFVSVFVSLIFNLAIIATLIVGLNYILKSDDTFVYIFSIFSVLSLCISSYICLNNLLPVLKPFLINLIKIIIKVDM